MPTDTIRASPYEKGLFFVGGTVGTNQWQVGTRYTLEKVLGHGGFSSVCLATDHQTGEKVALKRIPDVLSSPENAKRVLREVCILRRLAHPNIIAIKDCFVRPSATGQCRMVNGKLVTLSVDVYIAMEFGEGGDLFHLKGQLTAEEVKSVMWQLTHCIRYLHELHVWHRDLKSQNVFITWEGGELIAKLGDFGSARSAIPEGYPAAEQTLPSKLDTITTETVMHPSDSYDDMHRSTHPHDIYLRVEDDPSRPRPSYKSPLTRVVATPCYRAPEVVMSRGGYTGTIDMWGLGCIFGELLQRIAHVGSAATPNLQIAPLFAITDLPRTPCDGEKFGHEVGPAQATTRRELQALFDVIGTPAWADVAKVEHPAWRSYLHRLPGKAPRLHRRFGLAGEVAMDLLTRLLTFDPSRRCGAVEALAHEYFGDMLTAADSSGNLEEALSPSYLRARASSHILLTGSSLGEPGSTPPTDVPMRASRGDLAEALANVQMPRRKSGVGLGGAGTLAGDALSPFQSPRARHQFGPVPAGAAAAGAGPGGISSPEQLLGMPLGSQHNHIQQQQQWGPLPCSPCGPPSAAAGGGGDVAMSDASPFVATAAQPAAGPPPGQQQQHKQQQLQAGGLGPVGEEERILKYWEEKDPAKALGKLEQELATITTEDSAGGPASAGCQRLRFLLELECEAIAASHGGSWPQHRRIVKLRLQHSEGGVLGRLLQKTGPGLQLDIASDEFDPTDFGPSAAEPSPVQLDPEKYLGPHRHGEWTASTVSGAGTPAGPRWGVTTMPPGLDEATMDPHMAAVIKAQQLR